MSRHALLCFNNEFRETSKQKFLLHKECNLDLVFYLTVIRSVPTVIRIRAETCIMKQKFCISR